MQKNRTRAITIRVSEDERLRLNEKANNYGLTLSAYLRLSGLLKEKDENDRLYDGKEGML